MKKQINPYVHLEIPVDNIQRAQSFYEQVFHWSGKKLPIPMDYVMLDEGEDSRAGLISREEREKFKQTPVNVGPISYFFVKSIESYEQKIKQSGGTIITPTTDVRAGKFLIFKDTEDNIVGLWQQAHDYENLIKK